MQRAALLLMLGFPASLAAQSITPSAGAPDGVILSFRRFADIYGSRLVEAFDSIPESRYAYRPTPVQMSFGEIAQHLERANYGLCERFSAAKHPRTAKDSLADTIKARWPKDTLVARLKASLDFCDSALERAGPLNSAALASTLLGFETDLAEHYSQVANCMRLIGMLPPTALPPRQRVAIELPASQLTPYVGDYDLGSTRFHVALQDGALIIQPDTGAPPVRLWPESGTDFFVKEVDASVTFTRDASGAVNGLILHQYGRNRPAKKLP
jgi:hypothetical protein